MSARIIALTALGLMCALGSSAASGCVTENSKQMNGVLTEPAVDSWIALRSRMVREQLERRGINNPRVLKTMRKVPRERFVLEEYQMQAYDDGALPIGYGQTISQPYIVAFMTEALELSGTERVLEIGTGSGYQAAVLAELVNEVFSIELIEPLSTRAAKVLEELGYKNIRLKVGNGYQGWDEFAPYDAIIVTAAPPDIPETLVNQLKPGGRMILPVGTGFQDLILVKKTPQGIQKESLLPVRFVPMVDEKRDWE